MADLRRASSPFALVLNAFLAILSAALLLLIFPKFDLRFLAPIALTPLLIALANTAGAWQRFLFGWAAGIFYWFFLCTWIQFVLEAHGGMGFVLSWFTFGLFSVLKALHLAVFSLLAGPLMRRSYAVPAVAALWTGLERTHGTFGFAWLTLGDAGINMSLPLRLAPVVGVYGISFVFCMIAAGAACVVLRFPRMRLLPLLGLCLLWLLPKIPEHVPADREALVVQPNIDPDANWGGSFATQTESRLTLLSNTLGTPLVIWPEMPAPLYYYTDPEFHHIADDIAQRHSDFLFGTVAYTPEGAPMNSAVLLGHDGNEIGHYDKIYLVPFGEFVPPVFGWVNRITHEVGDFVPGHDIKVLPAGTQRLGVFICYESAFPHLVRQFSNKGADILVNLSNDSYFGRSEAREQHLELVRMRAVENRRFVIRSTNDGITAVVNPAGEIVQRLPSYTQVAATVRYGIIETTTFYARHGDWFAWGCLLIGIALAGNGLRKPIY